MQRLDRHDQTIATMASGAGGGATTKEEITVIPTSELSALRNRLEVLENTTLQGRVEALEKESPLKAVAAKGDQQFKLSQHVIPLTQLKTRVEGCEVGLQATGEQLDETNKRVSDTARALHEELQKYATKEELKALEEKHEKLVDKVGMWRRG